jgi:hypothetical protein
MAEIKDVLNLLGNELKDGSEEQKRFRDFIEQDKWNTEQLEAWTKECISDSAGGQDPHNRAFQDLIVSLGKKFGFGIEYGCYLGRQNEINNDGIWKRENEDKILIEVKTSTWPISSISQLGDYIERASKEESGKNIYGLYIIGKGDVQPLVEQILGSKYKDNMRLILYEDLLELLKLKDELETIIGERDAKNKVQNFLLPIESINIGNIIRLINEIAATKAETIIEIPPESEELWITKELIDYLNSSTPSQRLLLAAIVQSEKEPATSKTVTFLMKSIAKKNPSEMAAKKFTGHHIAGARAGLTMRRNNLHREDIIESSWSNSEKDNMYKIKNQYKQIVIEWAKKENLWITEDFK